MISKPLFNLIIREISFFVLMFSVVVIVIAALYEDKTVTTCTVFAIHSFGANASVTSSCFCVNKYVNI